jgi:hypothetical protein
MKHCVLMKFKQGTSDETKGSIFAMLEGLRQKDLGILEMVHGPFNTSPMAPTGLNRAYTDGLVVTFGSVGNRDCYNKDPDHQRILQEDIFPNLEGGINGLLRFDFVESGAKPAMKH